jgi:hypothetical protein
MSINIYSFLNIVSLIMEFTFSVRLIVHMTLKAVEEQGTTSAPKLAAKTTTMNRGKSRESAGAVCRRVPRSGGQC